MTGAFVQDRTPRLPPAYRLIALDRVESSNDEARRLAEDGAEDGTLVWAREQTKGRGRQGRDWASPPGNLYMTLILRPEGPPVRAAQLSFLAALAVGDAVGSVAPPMIEVRYKWPNDVLFNERKGAGILLESRTADSERLDWLLLGIGVNVVSHPEQARVPATNLRFEGMPAGVTAVDLLESFSRYFMRWVDQWLAEGFAPIRQAWLRHAKGLGETIEVRLPRETLSGRFQDLDGSGALLLELPEGTTRKITAGDVYFSGEGDHAADL